jgi:hypothetical protein
MARDVWWGAALADAESLPGAHVVNVHETSAMALVKEGGIADHVIMLTKRPRGWVVENYLPMRSRARAESLRGRREKRSVVIQRDI